MALIATDAVPKNGRTDSLDDAGLRPKGRRIVMLDGTELYAKIGQPLMLKFGTKELQLFPGSELVLSWIDDLVEPLLMKMDEHNTLLKSKSNEITLKKLPGLNERLEKIKADTGKDKETQDEEKIDAYREYGVEIALEIFKATHVSEKIIKTLSADKKFEVVQIILLDNDDPRGTWKNRRQKPGKEVLDAILSRDEYNADYREDEIDNLIHVYWQLNYSYGVEKKDVLSLRIPL